MAAAQAHHVKLRKKLGIPVRRSRRWWAENVGRRGKSGIRGVRRVIIRGESGRQLKFWMAKWSPAVGVLKKRQFSIKKHGEEKAKKLAIRARRAGVRSIK